ncbi:uncharacterized protein LOC143181701 [Calliopsis andreniformis]|uniref:uncharacterized protein LOC143181701 n=1 Tax=Calliopsis andreniformis TaxID=337506 RepID=UPI003FCE2E47
MQNWNQWQLSAGAVATPMPQPPVGYAAPGADPMAMMQAYMQYYSQPTPSGYTAEQWATAQQQNWAQWQQWQQQYQQWQAQYGEKYQETMKHMSAQNMNLASQMPQLPVVQPPPPLPKEDSKPPLPPTTLNTYQFTNMPPPHQNNLPLFPAKQNANTTSSMQNCPQNPPLPPNQPPLPPDNSNNSNRENTLTGKRGSTAISESTSAKKLKIEDEELTEAEKTFDAQFKQWEEQFNKWKEQNANHPDKTQYKQYEAKWTSWREKLIERREQMRRKREQQKQAAAKAEVEKNKNLPGDDKIMNILSSTENQGLINNLLGIGKSLGLTGKQSTSVPPPPPPPATTASTVPSVQTTTMTSSSQVISQSTPQLPVMNMMPSNMMTSTPWNSQQWAPQYNASFPSFSSMTGIPPPAFGTPQTQMPPPNFTQPPPNFPNTPNFSQPPPGFANNDSRQSSNTRQPAPPNLQGKPPPPFGSNSGSGPDGNLTHTERSGPVGPLSNFEPNRQKDGAPSERFGRDGMSDQQPNQFRPNDTFGQRNENYKLNDERPPEADQFRRDDRNYQEHGNQFNPQKMNYNNDRFAPGNDRFGPGNNRFGPPNDRFGPGNDRFGPGNDRPGLGNDRFGPGHSRFGTDRFGPGPDRGGQMNEPINDRFGPNNDRFGPGNESFGPGGDRFNLDRFDTKDTGDRRDNFPNTSRGFNRTDQFEPSDKLAPELKKLMEKRRAAMDVFKPSYLEPDKSCSNVGSLSESFKKITGDSPFMKSAGNNNFGPRGPPNFGPGGPGGFRMPGDFKPPGGSEYGLHCPPGMGRNSFEPRDRGPVPFRGPNSSPQPIQDFLNTESRPEISNLGSDMDMSKENSNPVNMPEQTEVINTTVNEQVDSVQADGPDNYPVQKSSIPLLDKPPNWNDNQFVEDNSSQKNISNANENENLSTNYNIPEQNIQNVPSEGTCNEQDVSSNDKNDINKKTEVLPFMGENDPKPEDLNMEPPPELPNLGPLSTDDIKEPSSKPFTDPETFDPAFGPRGMQFRSNTPFSGPRGPTDNRFPLPESRGPNTFNSPGPNPYPLAPRIPNDGSLGLRNAVDGQFGPRDVNDKLFGPRGPNDGSFGPRGPSDGQFGPRGVNDKLFGPRSFNDGPLGPRSLIDGPRGPNDGSFGPRGPTDSPLGPRGPIDGPFGPRGPNDGPFGPRGPNSGPFGPRGPSDGPFAPRGPNDGPFGPRGPTDGPFGPRGPTDVPFGPRGPTDGPFRPRGPVDGPFGPRGPTDGPFGLRGSNEGPFAPRGPNEGGPFGPRGPNEGPFAPRGPMDKFGPRGPMDNQFGPRGPNSGQFGPRGPNSGQFGPRYDDQFGPRRLNEGQFGPPGSTDAQFTSQGPNNRQFGPGRPNDAPFDNRGPGDVQFGARGSNEGPPKISGPNDRPFEPRLNEGSFQRNVSGMKGANDAQFPVRFNERPFDAPVDESFESPGPTDGYFAPRGQVGGPTDGSFAPRNLPDRPFDEFRPRGQGKDNLDTAGPGVRGDGGVFEPKNRTQMEPNLQQGQFEPNEMQNPGWRPPYSKNSFGDIDSRHSDFVQNEPFNQAAPNIAERRSPLSQIKGGLPDKRIDKSLTDIPTAYGESPSGSDFAKYGNPSLHMKRPVDNRQSLVSRCPPVKEFCIEKQFNYNHAGATADKKFIEHIPAKVIDYAHTSRSTIQDHLTPVQCFDYGHGNLKPVVPEHELYPKKDFRNWEENEQNLKEYTEKLRTYEHYSEKTNSRRSDTYRQRRDSEASLDDKKSERERSEKEDYKIKEREDRKFDYVSDMDQDHRHDKNSNKERTRERSETSQKEANKESSKNEDRSKGNINWQENSNKNIVETKPSDTSVTDNQHNVVEAPPKTLELAKTPNCTMVDDLLCPPGRQNRPPKIAIILRGPPGSGKSFVAKLIKDKEVEQGGSAPRILSLDDYFLVEKEIESTDDNGKKVTVKEMVYEYEEAMEQSYVTSLVKAFKKNITDGFFNFIILDCINEKISDYEEMWSFAKTKGFKVYVCEMEMDLQICLKRNIHNRTEDEINRIIDYFEPTPSYHQKLDVNSMLQDQAIEEVHMEDSEEPQEKAAQQNEEDSQDSQEDIQDAVGVSKWERMEAEDKLDRLDGLARKKNEGKVQTMQDFLQVPDYYNMEDTSGKKRVRWADLEERKEQEKMRAVGFVVGHTNWDRMMDPTKGGSALTRTKFFSLT